MIHIKLQLATRHEDLDIKTDIANQAAKDFAEHLETKLNTRKCDMHPTVVSMIAVVATPNGNNPFEVQKLSFCCNQFKDLFQFDFT